MSASAGAVTVQNVPVAPFVTDPATFFALTTKNVSTVYAGALPGQGQFTPITLRKVGVISKLRITFVGTLTVATASVVTASSWPYNILSSVLLSANGQNNLWNCEGIELKVLRFIRNPAYSEAVDTFPGSVGGGDTIATGTYNIYCTWELPIAMDDTSLVGSIFAQSDQASFNLELHQANNTDLFSSNPGNATLAGNFSLQETFFSIPLNQKGEMILPDLSRLHGFRSVPSGYNNVGINRVPLLVSNGMLERLFISASYSPGNRLSAMPNAVSSKKIDAVSLEFGTNQVPLNWNPAADLLSLNNQWYGSPAPYDRMVIDLVRENALRDTLNLHNLTELAVNVSVNSGVTVSGGQIRLAQETLFG